MSETYRQMTLFDDADLSTCSRAGLRARTSVPPGRAQGSRGSPAAALRSAISSGSLASFDPLGSLLKTCLLSELAVMTDVSACWRESATPAGRSWSVLERLAHPTEGSECGFWPTPATNDAARGPEAQHITAQSGKRHNTNLLGAAIHWPTPMASDGRPKGIGGFRNTLTLAYLAKSGRLDPANPNTPGKPRGSLNHRWVAQLQGLPADWTDLPDEVLSKLSATPTRRKSPS